MGVSAFHRSLWPEIIRRYKAGKEMKVIAEDLGVDRKTVYNVARRAGLPNRHRFDQARTDRILSEYKAGTPVYMICRAEGVHHSYVRAVAKRAGVPPRQGWQLKYPLNERAFDRPSRVGWWLVGLIAADGSICPRDNVIGLTQRETDSDVLHEFLKYVGSPNRPLIELRLSAQAARRTHPRSTAFAARVNSKHMCQVLGTYGITPRKSKTLQLREDVAERPAVWLGILDGDGWTSVAGQRGRPRIDFYGTPALMHQCSHFWGARLTFQRVSAPTVAAHAGGLGCVRLHGRNATEAAQILLASSPISLRRKRRTLQAIASLGSDRE